MSYLRRDILSLYRKLLQLHYKLPNEIKDVGVAYIKDEFKKHKDLQNEEMIRKFIAEWKMLAVTLENQLSLGGKIGKNLTDSETCYLSDDQWYQLSELYQETKKPK